MLGSTREQAGDGSRRPVGASYRGRSGEISSMSRLWWRLMPCDGAALLLREQRVACSNHATPTTFNGRSVEARQSSGCVTSERSSGVKSSDVLAGSHSHQQAAFSSDQGAFVAGASLCRALRFGTRYPASARGRSTQLANGPRRPCAGSGKTDVGLPSGPCGRSGRVPNFGMRRRLCEQASSCRC